MCSRSLRYISYTLPASQMGCFWCSEALFYEMDGVWSTQVGYAGGVTKNPTYREVCSGRTNHNEVVRVVFDPARVSFADLLVVFWETHNPTTPMAQGNDRGTQYRSSIFYSHGRQRRVALASRAAYAQALADAGRIPALPALPADSSSSSSSSSAAGGGGASSLFNVPGSAGTTMTTGERPEPPEQLRGDLHRDRARAHVLDGGAPPPAVRRQARRRRLLRPGAPRGQAAARRLGSRREPRRRRLIRSFSRARGGSLLSSISTASHIAV